MAIDNAYVFIVDDDSSVLKSLCWLIESVGYQVKAYESANAFLKDYDPSKAGCLVLDVRMPEVNGLELQELLHKRKIDIPIIFITAHGDIAMAVDAMKKGAVDFITKPINNQKLLDCVNKAIRLDIENRGSKKDSNEFYQCVKTLTPRETEIMTHLVSGKFTKNIASNLDISPNTVDVHRANIIKKMNVKGLSELIVLALRSGWDQLPES